jgi:hypothetical protein
MKRFVIYLFVICSIILIWDKIELKYETNMVFNGISIDEEGRTVFSYTVTAKKLNKH